MLNFLGTISENCNWDLSKFQKYVKPNIVALSLSFILNTYMLYQIHIFKYRKAEIQNTHTNQLLPSASHTLVNLNADRAVLASEMSIGRIEHTIIYK